MKKFPQQRRRIARLFFQAFEKLYGKREELRIRMFNLHGGNNGLKNRVAQSGFNEVAARGGIIFDNVNIAQYMQLAVRTNVEQGFNQKAPL